MALSERNKVIRKRGKKLMKYLEEMKWLIFEALQLRYRSAIGKINRPSKTWAFLRDFEKTNNNIKRIIETIVRGA